MKLAHSLFNQPWGQRLVLLALGGLLLVGLNVVLAQQPAAEFTQDEIDAKRGANWKAVISNNDQERKDIISMLSGEPMESAKFQEYFKVVVFPHFTRFSNAVALPDPKLAAKSKVPLVPKTELTKMRSEFRKTFFNRNPITDESTIAAASAARKALNDLVNDRMFKIAANQDQTGAPASYHPLVRFHAALFLAELQDEAVGLGAGRNPLAYQPAISSLSRLSAPRLVPDTTEPVRIVAIKALTNYLRQTKTAEPAVLKYLNDNVVQIWLDPRVVAVPPKLSVEGLDWIRRRTLELAVEINNRSPDPAKPVISNLPKILSDLLADENSAPEVRLEALKSLATMQPFPASLKAPDVNKSAGILAVAAVQRQLQEILGLPVPPYSAKTLKGELEAIDTSLKAIAEKTMSTLPWQDKLDAAIAACDTKWDLVNDPDALTKAIRKTGATLEIAVTGKERSNLEFDFVKVPKGFTGIGGISGGGSGGSGSTGRPSGGGLERSGGGR